MFFTEYNPQKPWYFWIWRKKLEFCSFDKSGSYFHSDYSW